LINKLKEIVARFEELEAQMADPALVGDQSKMTELAKEHRRRSKLVSKAREYISLVEQIEEDQEIVAGDDPDLKQLAEAELEELEHSRNEMEAEIRLLMLPKDPHDDKNTIVEIRAGTGGDEAALFAMDLYRMYIRFAERKGWRQEILESNEIGIGGYKEVIFSVEGDGAYGELKYESGVHRVQRVPKTETGGRIHTSAATVAILPEAEEADVEVNEADLKIDTYRASGAGGQHVNKTESAIRITHIPTGLVVTCQDEKSQHKNKVAAMKVLRSRLLALEEERIARERAVERKSMVSTGDRSAKIRTYNFPQGRVTDHRINFTSYNLEGILDGELDELIDNLKLADQQARLMATE
jgi:peptide chain release factor 1